MQQLIFPAWMMGNLLLALGAVGLAKRLGKGQKARHKALFAALAYPMLIVASGLIPGFFGVLSTVSVIGLAWILGLALIIICRQQIMTIDIQALAGRAVDWVKKDPFVAVPLFFVVAALLWKINLVMVPTAEIDSIYYHIPMAVHWLQEGTIWWQGSAFWSYFSNSEMLILWALLPFQGDLLVNAQSFFVLPLFILGLYCLPRSLGASRRGAMFVMTGLVGMDSLFRQILTQKNDIFVGAMLICALCFLLMEKRSPSRLFTVGFCLCISAVIGAKLIFWPFAAVPAALWAVMMIKDKKRLLPATVLLIVTLLIFAAPWLIRNAVLIHNPIHPAPWFGSSQWGIEKPYWSWTLAAHFFDPALWVNLPAMLLHSGNLVVLFFAFTLLAAPWFYTKAPAEYKSEFKTAALTASTFVILWLFLPMVTPTGNGSELQILGDRVRYGYVMWALGGAMFAGFFKDRIETATGSVLGLAVVFIAYLDSVYLDMTFVLSLGLALGVFGVLTLLAKAKRPGAALGVAIILAGAGALGISDSASVAKSMLYSARMESPPPCSTTTLMSDSYQWVGRYLERGDRIWVEGEMETPFFRKSINLIVRCKNYLPYKNYKVHQEFPFQADRYDIAFAEKQNCERVALPLSDSLNQSGFSKVYEDDYAAIYFSRKKASKLYE